MIMTYCVYRLDDLPSIKMCLDLSASYLLAADSKRTVSTCIILIGKYLLIAYNNSTYCIVGYFRGGNFHKFHELSSICEIFPVKIYLVMLLRAMYS